MRVHKRDGHGKVGRACVEVNVQKRNLNPDTFFYNTPDTILLHIPGKHCG
jgi:hypothetical protein